MEINTLSGNTMPLEIKLDKDYALYKLYSKKNMVNILILGEKFYLTFLATAHQVKGSYQSASAH